jgi:hypothetical protein
MRPKVLLTRDQKALARGVPGMAEKAARAVAKDFGAIRPFDEMVESAHYGIALAAQSFDPTIGKKYPEWAYFKAYNTILDDARAQGRQLAVLIAARRAGIEYLRHEHRAPRDEDAGAPEAELARELSAYKAGLVASMLEGVASMRAVIGDAEDEMNARIDAGRAAEALRRVHDGLDPEQVELLGCDGEADLKALAPKRGVSWWTLGRERNKLRKIVGARLLGLGVDAMPDWDHDVWRRVSARREAPGRP